MTTADMSLVAKESMLVEKVNNNMLSNFLSHTVIFNHHYHHHYHHCLSNRIGDGITYLPVYYLQVYTKHLHTSMWLTGS